ncbi:glycosyltransferase [Paraburkholderia sp. A1RI-2L]|uniref:glycosyltransferase n=1 Tax=Paraburkholderia sp. A1RI-2L TaxID=3028367 RepID=UPI003B8032C7
MKIETVIRDTRWFAESDSSQPDISVLLYAGANDTRELALSVESVLSQTLTAVQLVIVDDSGSAQVAQWLETARARDPHIVVSRRAYAIGVPAVGWIEAFTHARAPWFVLARSGDVFHEDALAALLACTRADPAVIPFGYVETVERAEAGSGVTVVSAASGGGQSMAVLRTRNFIGRHAVLIPREAVDAIGFVDPHVLLAQAAEWDFWRRLSERFELKAVDVAVGVTSSPAAPLGQDGWALEEWMRTRRNERLLPRNIGSYDMIAPNPAHGRTTREVCTDLALDLAHGRVGGDAAAGGTEGCILIVTLRYDASTALYFDMLPEPWQHRVRVVEHGPNPDLSVLAGASVLIVSRAIRHYRAWLDAAREVAVPAYYFLDDNMPVLVENGEARMDGEDFTIDALRKDLSQFDGVLLSSTPLIEYFRERNMHPRLLHFPVVCADVELTRAQLTAGRRIADDGEVVFAFMGGLHRSSAVWDVILPALAKIASEGQRIHFIAPGTGSDGRLDGLPASLRVTLLPWDPGYAFALRRFASLSPDYLLLAPGKTLNNRYKTLHPLLTAALVDAVAVLPRTDPYMDIEDGSLAVMVDRPFEEDDWYAVLRRIVDGRVDAARTKRNNDDFCMREFSGDVNVATLRSIAAAAWGVPSWPRQVRRLDALMHGVSTGAAAHDQNGAWARSLEELHALRHMRRYSWRHRVLARPLDLWEYCSPAFWALKRDTSNYGWRRRGGTLEFSDSLHMVPHRDYDVVLPAGTLGGVAFAFATDGLGAGKVTVDLISPAGQRVARVERDLARADLSQPVRFVFDPVEIDANAIWRIRVRCRTSTPVYVYEIVNRRGLGMFYGPPSPFMEILPPDPTRKKGRSLLGADGALTPDPALLDVKFVVEGDIPTNQIIQRLITEALGESGQITRLLLPQFTPEALDEGGLVILSRTASPASLPMLDWMRMHGVPFVYYIDDNFWELTGETPIAQFYQSAPVRTTLDRSIEEARHVIVNAPRLGEYIKERYPSARLVQLNAPFDFSLIDGLPAPVKPAGEVRVGFAGSITRADDFIEILPALERVLDTFAHVTLVFFGYCPPELVGRKRVTFVPHVASYSDFIRMKASYGLDIGLAPMADLASNLYKTNNKYREYGAMRIAGIYTNTSPYKESVTDGVTGMLVEHSPEAWFQALEKLIADTPLRKRIADAAYADIRTHYAQNVVADHWREFLLKFAEESKAVDIGTKTGRAGVAYIRARRWFGHTRIRALVLRARARAKMARAAKRFYGARN